MLIAPNEITKRDPNNQFYDVCICGAGPAGITLARKLAQKGKLVALMEGGGLQHNSQSQQLYQGDTLGMEYPISESRLRYFGGTSNHWGGETRPLDARDFQALPHHHLNKWPITKQDLDIYAAETNDILTLGNPVPEFDIFSGAAPHLPPIRPSFRFSRPITRFGSKYGDEIINSPHIHLYLNANLIDISLDSDHKRVSELTFRSELKSTIFNLKARHYVLCCGGLENPRTLLLANKQMPKGLGNQYGVVGRHFCEHIAMPIGRAVMREPITQSGFNICSDELIQTKKCLSFLVEFSSSGIHSDGSFFERMYEAIFKEPQQGTETEVYVIIQQACNLESRVTLSEKKDGLGLKQLALDWQLSALDKHTLRTAALEVASTIARRELGRMQVAPFVLDKNATIPVSYMSHHMCTTRMSDSPTQGVVDRNCRVFGIENLFIGGSSVFASSGVSNPTYTIVQLALRLGDHINQIMN